MRKSLDVTLLSSESVIKQPLKQPWQVLHRSTFALSCKSFLLFLPLNGCGLFSWQCCRTNLKHFRTLQYGQANFQTWNLWAWRLETCLAPKRWKNVWLSGQEFVIFTHLPLVSILNRHPNVVLGLANCLCLPCWKLYSCVYFIFETWLPATVFSSLLLAGCNFSIYTAEQQLPRWVKPKSDVFTVTLCKDYNEILFGSALQINIHLYGGWQGLGVADQNVNTRREWEAVIPQTPRGAVKAEGAPCRAARPTESWTSPGELEWWAVFLKPQAQAVVWSISPSASQVWFGACQRAKVLHVLSSSPYNTLFRVERGRWFMPNLC